MSVNPSPPAAREEGWALIVPVLLTMVMSWGPPLAVNDEIGAFGAPAAAWAPVNVNVPKLVSDACWQKIKKQIWGASATHSADALASDALSG